MSVDDKAIGVAGVLAEALLVNFLAAVLGEQALELVVLDIDSQVLPAFFVDEGGDGSDCLSRLAADCDRVELEVSLAGHAQESTEGPER